jgi:hypothetical protein
LDWWNWETEPTKPTPNSSVFSYVENRTIVDSWKSKFTATERTEPILKPNAPPWCVWTEWKVHEPSSLIVTS